MLRNCTETALRELLPGVLGEFLKRNPEACTCLRCLEDALALALNGLPPRYATTEEGAVLVRAELEQPPAKARMVAALLGALQRVTANPRHERGREPWFPTCR